MLTALATIVLVGFDLASALCMGVVLLRIYWPRAAVLAGVSSTAWLVSAFLLGLGILAHTWVLIGLLGWIMPGVIAGVLSLPLFLGARPALRQCRDVVQELAIT